MRTLGKHDEAFITWVTYESDISASREITQMSQTPESRSKKKKKKKIKKRKKK